MFLSLKHFFFDARILINRLPSFSVLKIYRNPTFFIFALSDLACLARVALVSMPSCGRYSVCNYKKYAFYTVVRFFDNVVRKQVLSKRPFPSPYTRNGMEVKSIRPLKRSKVTLLGFQN